MIKMRFWVEPLASRQGAAFGKRWHRARHDTRPCTERLRRSRYVVQFWILVTRSLNPKIGPANILKSLPEAQNVLNSEKVQIVN